MGIFKRKITYRTDRGEEYEVEKMASAHLLNAIAHHSKQADTCQNIINRREGSEHAYLIERLGNLQETVQVLEDHLRLRDPAKDFENDDC